MALLFLVANAMPHTEVMVAIWLVLRIVMSGRQWETEPGLFKNFHKDGYVIAPATRLLKDVVSTKRFKLVRVLGGEG